MTNIDKNELMAEEIKELLIKYNICNGTGIYYNNKRVWCHKGQIEVMEGVKIEDYLEWGNPETLTLSYEGVDSLYLLVNGYASEKEDKEKADKVMAELLEIGKKYNRWFDKGNDNILFYIDDEESSSDDEDEINWGKLGGEVDKYYLRSNSK